MISFQALEERVVSRNTFVKLTGSTKAWRVFLGKASKKAPPSGSVEKPFPPFLSCKSYYWLTGSPFASHLQSGRCSFPQAIHRLKALKPQEGYGEQSTVHVLPPFITDDQLTLCRWLVGLFFCGPAR